MSTPCRTIRTTAGAAAAFVVACTSQSAVVDGDARSLFRTSVSHIVERCYHVAATSATDSAEAFSIQQFSLVRLTPDEDSTLPRGMRILDMPNATSSFSLRSRGWGMDSLSDSIRLSAAGPMGGIGIVLVGKGDSLVGYATGFSDAKVDNPPWATVIAHRVECATPTPK